MMREKEESAVSVVGRLAGRLILMSVAVLVLFLAARYSFDFGKSIFYQKPVAEAPGTDVSFELPEGTGYSGLAKILFEKGVVSNELAVAVQAQLYKTELEPGHYTVNTSMTTKEILTAVNEKALELKEEKEKQELQQTEDVVGAGDEGGEEPAEGN